MKRDPAPAAVVVAGIVLALACAVLGWVAAAWR